jgi:hypothetical protein
MRSFIICSLQNAAKDNQVNRIRWIWRVARKGGMINAFRILIKSFLKNVKMGDTYGNIYYKISCVRFWLWLNCVTHRFNCFLSSFLKVLNHNETVWGTSSRKYSYMCVAGISLGTGLSRGKKQDRQRTYDVTLRCFRATIVAVVKQ